jgi:ketosteroid isomerase-like protein
MRTIIIALALAILSQGAAVAQDKTAVIASVHQFVDAFNKGDTEAMVATCTDQAFVIDEFPPYEWHGSGACAKWASDYEADAKKNVITDGVVTLRAPRHVEITASRAYVVVPADYAYKQKTKAVKETGSMLTVVLQKGASSWLLIGWTWARN